MPPPRIAGSPAQVPACGGCVMSLPRFGALSALLLAGACASSPEVSLRDAVPLPRPRPAAAHLALPAVPKPSGEADLQENMNWNNELARKWTLCKLLFA